MQNLATDLDGTIYIENKLIENVKESHEKLLKNNFNILYTTNNSSQHPLGIANKLENLLNIKVDIKSIVTPLNVLSDYLSNVNLNLYIYGSDQLIEYVNKISKVTNHIEEADLILVGRKEIINENQISKIIKNVKKGKKIMGMNKDLTFPTYDDKEKKGNGAVLKIIENEIGTNIKSFGKPETLYRNYLINNFKSIDFMIGDRIDTDIILGNSIGAKTFLVNSPVKNHIKCNIADYSFNNFSESVSFILKDI